MTSTGPAAAAANSYGSYDAGSSGRVRDLCNKGRRRTGRGPQYKGQDRRDVFDKGAEVPGRHRGAGLADAGSGGTAHLPAGVVAPARSSTATMGSPITTKRPRPGLTAVTEI